MRKRTKMWTAQIGKAAMEADNDQKEEEEVPRPGLASRVADIKKALALGQCDLRSGIGQQFKIFLQRNEAEEKKYEACSAAGPGKVQAAKKEFRLNWLKEECGRCTIKKTYLEAWQVVDEEHGVYEPLERIVWYEGGRESNTAWLAGLNYAAACAALGGKWIQWNDMTKRPELFYVKKIHKTTFRRAWSLMKEMQRDIKPEAAAAETAAAAAAAAAATATAAEGATATTIIFL